MKIKNVKTKKQKRKSHGSGKDHYTIINVIIMMLDVYTPFYGTGEQLQKFALKIRKEKYEGKLPKRVSIELVG